LRRDAVRVVVVGEDTKSDVRCAGAAGSMTVRGPRRTNSFDPGEVLLSSSRAVGELQYATTKGSSDSVWFTTIILTAGSINHLMSDEEPMWS